MRTLFTFVFFCVSLSSCKSKSEPKTSVETAVASNKIIKSDEDISKYLVIELNPKNPKFLQTIRGTGYVLWIK